MSALLVGYARVSTHDQDLTAQRDALAACRSGDTLVVTKLDRLARSLPDARDILEDLTTREVKLSIGGSVHDPTDPVGRLLFNVLAMVAEFESDLIRLRTKEGMRVAKAKGHLRGRPPKLNPRQEAQLVTLYRAGEHSTAELSDLFGVGRSTVYRVIERDGRRRNRANAPSPEAALDSGPQAADATSTRRATVFHRRWRPAGPLRPLTSRCSGCADDQSLLRDRDPDVLRGSRAAALPCRLRGGGGGDRDCDGRDSARRSAGSRIADGARMGVDASR
jgi:DNA invertase Pin-like site-specific DNA recombinase